MICPNCKKQLEYRIIEEVIILGEETTNKNRYLNFLGYYKSRRELNNVQILICCVGCTFAERKGLESVRESVKQCHIVTNCF